MSIVRVLAGFLLIWPNLGIAQSGSEINFDGLRNSNPGAIFDHGYVVAGDIVQVHSATLYDPEGRKMVVVTSFKLRDGTKTIAPLSAAVDNDGVLLFPELSRLPH